MHHCSRSSRNLLSLVAVVAMLVACGTDDAPSSRIDAGEWDAGSTPIDSGTQQGPTCGALRSQSVGGCLSPIALFDDAGVYEPLLELQMTGQVLEIAHGTWQCVDIGASSNFAEKDTPWRFRLSDGVQEVWVGFVLPWPQALVSVGDVVTVEYAVSATEYGVWSGHLWMRRDDGETLLWLGYAGSTAELHPPNVTLTDANDACVVDDGCITKRAGFQLSMDSAAITLGYGQQADFGPYVALHGGNVISPTSGPCTPDFPGEGARLALVRGSVETLREGSM